MEVGLTISWLWTPLSQMTDGGMAERPTAEPDGGVSPSCNVGDRADEVDSAVDWTWEVGLGRPT